MKFFLKLCANRGYFFLYIYSKNWEFSAVLPFLVQYIPCCSKGCISTGSTGSWAPLLTAFWVSVMFLKVTTGNLLRGWNNTFSYLSPSLPFVTWPKQPSCFGLKMLLPQNPYRIKKNQQVLSVDHINNIQPLLHFN